MSWSTAVSDLRVALSDGPLDRLCSMKKIFGIQNGQNRVFKTLEFRRVTDFSASGTSFPLGVQVDGAFLAASAISQDNPDSGFFEVISTAAPTDSQQVTCTYYAQWFVDAELVGFLQRASEWMGFGAAYAGINPQFKTAALKYALAEAYGKIAIKVATPTSAGFQLEDAPDETKADMIRAYQTASKNAMDAAYKARDDVYSRQGQAKAPRFATVSGNIQNPTRS